jgi:hypothetical protein
MNYGSGWLKPKLPSTIIRAEKHYGDHMNSAESLYVPPAADRYV